MKFHENCPPPNEELVAPLGNVTKSVKALLPQITKYVAKKFECQCRCQVLK